MGYCSSSDPARSGAIKRRSSWSMGSTVSSGKSAIALVYWMSSLGIPRLTLSFTGPSATKVSSNPVLPPYSVSSPASPSLCSSPVSPLCSSPHPPRLLPHRPSIPTCPPIVHLLPYSTFALALS